MAREVSKRKCTVCVLIEGEDRLGRLERLERLENLKITFLKFPKLLKFPNLSNKKAFPIGKALLLR